ncbi:sigma-70 family RNA polymerase sigma factor [Xanthobacter sp. DSM 24535]|uniref:sigma-70 family RNA polymerase sigma factor n=1 Tax=Roseixanthobacter psychrophilus TaxID=3119917 RepID=UPI00372CA2EF
MPEASDEDLMARVAQGDETAFRSLTERYVVRAVALARRFLGNSADAEDIAQDAFIAIWRAAPRWQPSAAFGTWFYRIVVNLCLNHRRRRAFVPLEEAAEVADGAPDAIERILRSHEDRVLALAVGALPERQRAAVLLTYWEGFSNARTAEILDTSVSGVETLLVRARRSLRARLGSVMGEE